MILKYIDLFVAKKRFKIFDIYQEIRLILLKQILVYVLEIWFDKDAFKSVSYYVRFKDKL